MLYDDMMMMMIMLVFEIAILVCNSDAQVQHNYTTL